MVKVDNLDRGEILIIRKICIEQFKSLKRLYDNHKEKEILNIVEKTLEEGEKYKKSLIRRARKYQAIKKSPEKVFIISGDELSSIKHTLNQFDDEYRKEYPKAVSLLWSKFFFMEKVNNFSFN